ncbi:hypothetical protein AB1K32_15290 [Metabacillus dongyingensis]|uniref:hypothetical protein n=1 Tax=Metabacillus dongyingensis TaxID=2874282 RepID=UPI003B8C8447
MIIPAWDYIAYEYDENGRIPSEEEIVEALHHQLTPEDIDNIPAQIKSFISFHDMEGITIEEEINVNFVFNGEQVVSGEKVLTEKETNFAYRSKSELVEAIRSNPESFADLLMQHEVVVEKEVS